MELKVCHLYPELLNLYGDTGNIAALKFSGGKMGFKVSVERMTLGDRRSFGGYDIIFIGGGQDSEQRLIAPEIKAFRGAELRAAVSDGITVLGICGGYQLLGHYYETLGGEKLEFSGAVGFYSKAFPNRAVGALRFKCLPESGGAEVTGFENHSGRTFLDEGISPLGTVTEGVGNNGGGGEGVRFLNAFGTYSHGPLLPNNPDFCRTVLMTALKRKGLH